MGQMLVGASTDMIGEMVTEWIKGLAKMLAQWLANLLLQETTQKTSDATRLATGGAARVSEATGQAQVAAVSAAASVAAIPVFGWMMWVGVYAATLAALMPAALAASAAGGFDVPRGMNPVTQLHAEEMVLPAHLVNAVRGMTGSGGGAGGSTQNSMSISISAMDGASVERVLRGNPRALSKVAQSLVRDRKVKL